jgi:hypothetical protein
MTYSSNDGHCHDSHSQARWNEIDTYSTLTLASGARTQCPSPSQVLDGRQPETIFDESYIRGARALRPEPLAQPPPPPRTRRPSVARRYLLYRHSPRFTRRTTANHAFAAACSSCSAVLSLFLLLRSPLTVLSVLCSLPY